MQAKPSDYDFKIIGVRPGQNCVAGLHKVLSKNEVFYLLNGYVINADHNFEKKAEPSHALYHYESTPTINISAIAGQNGAGKSTIIELLLMAINNVAFKKGMKDDLVSVTGIEVDIYYKTNKYHRLHIENEDILLYDYDDRGVMIKDNRYPVELDELYYSVVMNYSHYAYNSKDILAKGGSDWLTPLFHKNDSYQTPVVINPYRTEGNVNINIENDLVGQRLITNLLRPQNGGMNFRELTENLVASKFILEINSLKFEKELYRIYKDGNDKEGTPVYFNELTTSTTDIDKVLNRIHAIYPIRYKKGKYSESGADETDRVIMRYIVKKLITIATKYIGYKDRNFYWKKSGDFNWDRFDTYIRDLIQDPSHVTFKLKQALNYLKYEELRKMYITGKELDIQKLATDIHNFRFTPSGTKRPEIIELIPPTIFEVKIKMDKTAGDPQRIDFDTLSSGEKQLIYSNSSVLYHLLNLESVNEINALLKYRNVVIILEEIELYFHPEMQRRYIYTLLESISRLDLKKIWGIQLIFVTHSPFILSDIPTSNVLFLRVENGEAIQVSGSKKTFGANIHNLLADAFFMNNGLCGEFAIKKINETVTWLNKQKRIKFLSSGVRSLDEKLELSNLKAADKDDKLVHKQRIDFIGEFVMASKLAEMYDEIFEGSSDELIRKEIKRLENLLSKPLT